MSEVPKLERSNKKNQGPRNDQFLFILYLKNEFVKLTEGYPPTTGRGGYRSVSLIKYSKGHPVGRDFPAYCIWKLAKFGRYSGF